MEKLKPCPFCGGTNIKMYGGICLTMGTIECEDCGAYFEVEIDIDTKKMTEDECTDKLCDELMKCWNRRVENDGTN